MQHFIRIGVRFSIDNIQGVLPNLLELAQIGISFIKLRPHDFNNGIQCNDTTYKGSEIKKAFQRAGIILCAADIDAHEDLLICVENKADLLQGNLLGEKERSDRLAL
jgi:EAL domain-containing protein (putative c-di-GMP-specific phosphodiesterase class I)